MFLCNAIRVFTLFVAFYCSSSSIFGTVAKEDYAHGSRLFEAQDYSAAAHSFKKALEHLGPEDEALLATLRYQLAYALFSEKEWAQALEALALPQEHALVPFEHLLLAGLIHIQLENGQKALDLFKTSLTSKDIHESEKARAYLEMGKIYREKNENVQAREMWEKITPDAPLTYYFVSQLRLVELAIEEENFKEGSERLAHINSLLPKDDVLRYEVAFWKGEAAFKEKRHKEAVNYYLQAIPLKNSTKAAWVRKTKIRLVNCYEFLADSSRKKEEVKSYLDQAEVLLTELKAEKMDEEIVLLLGSIYLKKGIEGNSDAQKKLELLLLTLDLDSLSSSSAKAYGLFLKFASTTDSLQQNALFQRLLKTEFVGTEGQIKTLLLKGRSDFQEGCSCLEKSSSTKGALFLEKAFENFRLGYQICVDRNSPHTIEFLRAAFETAMELNQTSTWNEFESLLNTPNARFCAISEDEFLYLKGITAFNLQKENISSFEIEEYWKKIIQKGTESPWFDKALFNLGTFYFQKGQYDLAQSTFIQLTSEAPLSSFVGDAWFYSSQAAEKQGHDIHLVRAWRKKVWQDFPLSSLAAEAYFTTYSLKEYLEGQPDVLSHLIEMPAKFPDSVWILPAYYLIGMQAKKGEEESLAEKSQIRDLQKAIEAFQNAESTFERLVLDGKLSEDLYFEMGTLRYRALIERALANGTVAGEAKGAKKHLFFEYAAELLRSASQEWEDPLNPLTRLLAKNDPYPSLSQECDFYLAQMHRKMEEDDKACYIFDHMLEKYRRAKMMHSYYLARLWIEKGLIHMHKQEWEAALEDLEKVPHAAKAKVLSAHQKLTVMLLKSQCCRALKQYDQAMRILSDVINDPVVSTLRLKAMYLRAEVYEEQGRSELALKQLEALAKKGGDWGHRAENKLEQDYGF